MNEQILHTISEYKRSSITTFELAKFVLLCGKDRKLSIVDNRTITEELLRKNRDDIFVIYSEEVFSVIKNGEMDLLKFEEILAEISDGIILFLESFGTATELGAFTYLDNLASKLLVFIDEKHERDNSFINGGPVSRIKSLHLDDKSIGDVIYTKFLYDKSIDIGKPYIYNRLVNFCSDKKVSFKKENFLIDEISKTLSLNPQILIYFIIDLVFVLEFVPKRELFRILAIVLKMRHYEINIELDSRNRIKHETVKEYFIKILIKWNVLKESVSPKTNEKLLSINELVFIQRPKIRESYGKVLFTQKLFSDRKFLELKYDIRKYNKSRYGDVYVK